jgi:hypothetical protein
LAAALTAGCTKKPEAPEVAALRSRLLGVEKQMLVVVTKLKNPDLDPGTKSALDQEKQLLQGRLDRLVYNWGVLAPRQPVPELPVEGGEH